MARVDGDLGDRIHLFHDYMDAVKAVPAKRAFHDVHPDITGMVASCIPVGLNNDGTLALPKSYEPEDGPPVLMIRKGENPEIRWSEGMQKVLDAVLDNVDANLQLSYDFFADTPSARPAPGLAYVQSELIDLEYHATPDTPVTPLFVPKYLGIRSEHVAEGLAAPVLAHELDHWNFFLHTAPLLSRIDEPFYSATSVKAIAEKRAYITSYAVEDNLGIHRADFPIPSNAARRLDELIDTLQDMGPAEAGQQAREHLNTLGYAASCSLAAVALAHLFADESATVPVTWQEVVAFQSAEII